MKIEFWIFNLHWIQLSFIIFGSLFCNVLVWQTPQVMSNFVNAIGRQIMFMACIMASSFLVDSEALKMMNEIAAEIILMHLSFIIAISWQAFLPRTKNINGNR